MSIDEVGKPQQVEVVGGEGEGTGVVQTKAAVSDEVTDTWTSATSDNATVVLPCSGYSVAMFVLGGDVDFEGGLGSAYFEVSADGGANWSLIDTVEPYTIESMASYRIDNFDGGGWTLSTRADVAGYTHVRVRLDTNTIVNGILTITLRATGGKVPHVLVKGHVTTETVITNGSNAALGATTDAEATSDGTLIAIAKRLRTLLNGGLPAALSNGRLKVEQNAAEATDATATWDSATVLGTALSISVQGMATVLLDHTPSGTLTGGSLGIEGSVDGGTTWSQLLGHNPYWLHNRVEGIDPTADLAGYPFTIPCAGYTHVRVVVWDQITGEGSMALRLRATAAPATPIVDVVAGDGRIEALGATNDDEATGNGGLIAITKRLRTLLSGGLPAALGAGGGLKVDGSGTALPVSGTFWQATQPVSGTVAATQSGTWNVTNVSGTVSLPTGAATAAKQPALGTAGSPSTDVISVQGVASGTSLPVKEARAATATLTNVNDTNSNTTLLAANANRLGATIFNDSTAVLYVKLGTNASATSFTVKMSAGAYYEVPFNYTGIIDGIWASDASGAARITELSA